MVTHKAKLMLRPRQHRWGSTVNKQRKFSDLSKETPLSFTLFLSLWAYGTFSHRSSVCSSWEKLLSWTDTNLRDGHEELDVILLRPPSPDPATCSNNAAPTKPLQILREWCKSAYTIHPGDGSVHNEMHWAAVRHGCLQNSEHNEILGAKASPSTAPEDVNPESTLPGMAGTTGQTFKPGSVTMGNGDIPSESPWPTHCILQINW